ncbi:MAG: bifunctional riboflavin kinase/FAD synthetase [Cyanobacteria bacterium]|nr:bifunctional riboflavin kinase/FAD synthetase [Cyanobacteriota bacterium]MDW8201899.1 bifunctional riboflavin kinase/FAD synthetase [Cyanobacteriota bacterium SKYGB_h_bin112]
MWITSLLNQVRTPNAIALGNFDGLHRGHQAVMAPILQGTFPSGVHRTLVTFQPHPQEFFTGQPRSLLTPLEEKIALLQTMGFDQLILLPFNRELAALTPPAFVDDILSHRLQAKVISVGMDFCFGYQRSGTADDLRTLAQAHGIATIVTPLQRIEGDRISSSAIRQALLEGDPQRARHLLGRAYRLIGSVVQGQQLGRRLGFPTANLQLPPEKFLPRRGVYAVTVQGVDALGNPLLAKGVMNIGCRPTVDGTAQTVEVHLLDWSGDLYGQTIMVDLDTFLRPEQQFASLEELTTQIQLDCTHARAHWQLLT